MEVEELTAAVLNNEQQIKEEEELLEEVTGTVTPQ